VTVNVSTSAVLDTERFTSNGVYFASSYSKYVDDEMVPLDGFSKVYVSLDTKDIRVCGSSGTFNAADYGYNGFGTVTLFDESVISSQSTIGYGQYSNILGLSTVSLPYATEIGMYGFAECKDLTVFSAPLCTTVSSSAFDGCMSISDMYLPKVTSITSKAFRGARISNLTIGLQSISDENWFNYANIGAINLPSCTSICSSAFYSAKLQQVDAPLVTTIGMDAFRACISLTSVSFPECRSIGSYAFYGCTSLSVIGLPKASYLSGKVFEKCQSGLSVYLSGGYVCNVSDLTPFVSDQQATVYVPQSLYNSYSEAWSRVFYLSPSVSLVSM
jgi:hypothetical protein